MKYVLDASVALKWVLPESDSAKALVLQDEFAKQLVDLVAPDIFPVEVAHVLAKAERRKIISPPVGSQYLTDILNNCPHLEPSLGLLARAFEIASNARIGVYDCLYVALAEREKAPLITADQRLLGLQGFPLLDLASF